MALHPPLRLKELLLHILVLLQCTERLQGDKMTGADRHIQCVNNYLYTINCSLNILPSESTSVGSTVSHYWLTVTETFDELEYECLLKHTAQGYLCSIDKREKTPDVDIFTDLDSYEISLCPESSSASCEVLDEEYNPSLNIKPNAPCCLTVDHNSSQVHFTWRSTYEEFSSFTGLTSSLRYELLFYKTEDEHKAGRRFNTESTSCSVDGFEPDTEYTARVRSSPNNVHYKGQWSDWSSEDHWRMAPAVNVGYIFKDTAELDPGVTTKTPTLELPVAFGAVGVMVVIVLVLYYGPIKMWRQSTFIPTPAPYFHSLYRDYQGDFKSWVVTHENTSDTLKAEEALKIDTLVQFRDTQGDRSSPIFQQWMEGSGYRNIPAPGCDADLSMLYTDSSWLPAQGSSGSPLPAWSGSPAEDSGCWLCSDTSLEREPPWYCNEYCTLSGAQQSSCVSEEHHGNPAQHRLSA